MGVRRQEHALLVGLILCFAFASFHISNATTDDAFITFRYSEQLANGNGLVFNPGERVEGYSNFLFTVLMSLVIWTGLSDFPHGVLVFSKAIGLLFGLLCIPLIFRASALLSKRRRESLVIKLLAPILIASSMQFACWAVSGLETLMCAFFVLMAQFFCLRMLADGPSNTDLSRRRLFAYASFFFLLASLTRPEIPILFVASLIVTSVYFWRRRIALRTLLPGILAFGLSYVAFICWRLAYYGDVFPNTFYAKATGDGGHRLWEGLTYWGFGIGTVIGPLIILSFLPLLRRSDRDFRYIFLLWQFVAMSVFVIYSGGDWMGAYRLFIPIFPAIALMAQQGAQLLWQRLVVAQDRAAARKWFAAIVVAIVVGVFAFHSLDFARINGKPSGFLGRDMLNQEYYQIAKLMREQIRPATTVALGEAGLIPYYSGLDIIDMRGLMDRYIARLEGEIHAKFDPMYVFRRRPDYLLMVDMKSDLNWAAHNYENMLLDHEVLYKDYRLAGSEDLLDVFYKYHFLLYERKGFQFGSKLD
ncbi:hypothetical protein J7M28_01985 [bacterium]|nr:hypothetical protein [bacterium]